MNLFYEFEFGLEVLEVVYVFIEILKGSRNKYEFDKKIGFLKFDRVFYSLFFYLVDYGIILQIWYDDGDFFDIMVIMCELVYLFIIVEVRLIGIMKMEDSGDKDWKVLVVFVEDLYFKDWKDIDDVLKVFFDEIVYFFQRYKEL